MHLHISTLVEKGYAMRDGINLRPTILGKALIEGYKSMGVELWKPKTRKELNDTVKAISVREMTKDDALNEWKDRMKGHFRHVEKEKKQAFGRLW
ncbi:DNA topoisomerase 3-alpha-like [Helianthus annuus]|uniref:DNA topoisomerase 3-alpha-like n=1 Tax=Helianthus annuus TaxID=4232 RepID=UPI000B8FA88B|nr:DNA topoisomerase 3-alpha-like [Helianthus annuus]XP_021969139.1 DNA topoisomerase 3-alpha-like [Helianthus annuus]